LTWMCGCGHGGLPGDIQIGMMDKKGQLEVEVIRARGLVQKPGSKSLPGKVSVTSLLLHTHTDALNEAPGAGSVWTLFTATDTRRSKGRRGDRLRFPLMAFSLFCLLPSAPYVKVYLLNNGAYVAKKKTKIARKTLDPLYQQALLFEESPQGKVLQVMSVYIYCIYISCFDSNVLFHYRWLYLLYISLM